MVEYLSDNYDTQSRMFQVIKDMEAMGSDVFDIEEKIGKRLKNQKRLDALMNGEYIAPNISEARIEGLFERLYEENPTEAARIENEFDTALSIFEDLRFDLESIELGEGVDSFKEFINFTLNPPSGPATETTEAIGIEQIAELPVPQGLDTPVNTNIINQSIGNVQNDLLRQIELQKLI